MMSKLIWIGLFVGSTIGGFIPSLWGAGVFSLSGAVFSTLGGIFGTWFGYRVGNQ